MQRAMPDTFKTALTHSRWAMVARASCHAKPPANVDVSVAWTAVNLLRRRSGTSIFELHRYLLPSFLAVKKKHNTTTVAQQPHSRPCPAAHGRPSREHPAGPRLCLFFQVSTGHLHSACAAGATAATEIHTWQTSLPPHEASSILGSRAIADPETK